MADKTNQTSPGIQLLETDGLYLSGVVVAVDQRDVEWEGQKYKQVKATLTDGSKTFLFTADDKKEKLPEIKNLKRAEVLVDYARTEKGGITVRGRFSHV